MATILRVGGGTTISTSGSTFGDGSDGVGVITANTVWSAPTADTGYIVKNFQTLTIPENVTVSAGNRNMGMIIRVAGDCTIGGTIENRLSPKTLTQTDIVDFSLYPAIMLTGSAGDGGTGGVGSDGSGDSIEDYGHYSLAGGAGGAGMLGRFYGGGWSGGGGGGGGGGTRGYNGGSATTITTAVADTDLWGATDAGGDTVYGGGGEGGGFYANWGDNGGKSAGASGSRTNYAEGGGGGAGNIGGGVVILFVGGNLTIGAKAKINCSGGAGGNGAGAAERVYFADVEGDGYNWLSAPGAGGGGAGGGRIFICYKNNLVNNGTLDVSGGAGGSGGPGKTISGESVRTAGNGVRGEDGDVMVLSYKDYRSGATAADIMAAMEV